MRGWPENALLASSQWSCQLGEKWWQEARQSPEKSFSAHPSCCCSLQRPGSLVWSSSTAQCFAGWLSDSNFYYVSHSNVQTGKKFHICVLKEHWRPTHYHLGPKFWIEFIFMQHNRMLTRLQSNPKNAKHGLLPTGVVMMTPRAEHTATHENRGEWTKCKPMKKSSSRSQKGWQINTLLCYNLHRGNKTWGKTSLDLLLPWFLIPPVFKLFVLQISDFTVHYVQELKSDHISCLTVTLSHAKIRKWTWAFKSA